MGITKGELIIIIFTLFLFIVSMLKYVFPHFSMHFFKEGPIAGMNLQSDYFTGRCNHKESEIEVYRKKQKPMLIVFFIVLTGITIFFILN